MQVHIPSLLPARALRRAQVMIVAGIVALYPALRMSPAAAQGMSRPWAQSDWVRSHAAAARLVGGRLAPGTTDAGNAGAGPAATPLLAGVEVKLDRGWKTYWRNPGDAGGLAPTFDWSGSRNVGSVEVLYPAPVRMKDAGGQNIGYKGEVIFPARITAVDATKPVTLSLRFDYGICLDICVPAEARLSLTIGPQHSMVPAALRAMAERVPRTVATGASRLKSAKAQLSGPSARIELGIAVAAGETGTSDLFVEAPAGIHMPMAEKAGVPTNGEQRFIIDLKGIDDAAKLAGKPLRLTMTGPAGASETSWTVR